MAAPLRASFVGVDGRGIGGTVVTLRSTDAARPVAAPTAAVLDQVDLKFVPHVLALPEGSRWLSRTAIRSPPGLFLLTGQAIPAAPVSRQALPSRCSSTVRAWSPWVATSTTRCGPTCTWSRRSISAERMPAAPGSAGDVEPGEYRVEIWHPLSRVQRPVLEQLVTVPANGAKLTLRAAMPLKLRPESQCLPTGTSTDDDASWRIGVAASGGQCPRRGRGQPRPATGEFRWSRQFSGWRTWQAAIRC